MSAVTRLRGGTGTYDLNTWVTEIQAGSYALMDTAYGGLGLPFEQALSILATVISVERAGSPSATRPQVTRDGPRQPVDRGPRGLVLLGRARHFFAPGARRDMIRVLPLMSTRPSPITRLSTSPTVTR